MPHRGKRRLVLAAAGVVVSGGLGVSVASAQSWTGASLSGNNWSDGANWAGGVPPVSGNTTVINFGGPSVRTSPNQNIGNPFDLNQLNFTAGATTSYTLTGNPLRMQGTVTGFDSSSRITQNSAVSQTLATEVQLPLTNTRYIVEGNGAGVLNVNGGITGAGLLVKRGTHTLALNSALTASSGGTVALEVGGGTFRLGADNLIASDIQLFTSGGTFDLNGRSQTFDLLFGGAGTIAMGGGTLTLGVSSNGGQIRGLTGAGSLIKGPGSAQMDFAQPTFTGSVAIENGGTIFLSANDALGTAATGTTVAAGGSLTFTGANYTTPEPVTLQGTALTSAIRAAFSPTTFAGPITLTGASDIGCAGGASALTLTGGINLNGNNLTFGDTGGTVTVNTNGISGGGGIVKVHPNETLVINANSTYTGGTSLIAGLTEVNASLATTTINVATNATLQGTATANSAVFTLDGDLRPGTGANGVGRISVSSAFMNGGGEYFWDIQNANGGAGTSYDELLVNGALSAPSSGGNVTVHVRSLNPGGLQGALVNFNNALAYEWVVIDAASLNPNVELSDFSLETSGFSANDLGGGTLSLALTAANDLVVRFTPVPEPSALLTLAAGVGAAATVRRPRRRG